MNKKTLTGKRFGRLLVLKDSGERKWSYILWFCLCDCGNSIKTIISSLRTGATKSCGCIRKERMASGVVQKKHGDHKERLYQIWKSMKKRCYNPRHNHYRYYGGKGIKICDPWKNNYSIFKFWAILNGYQDNLTIDRIDNNENYTPINCRWITQSENSSRNIIKMKRDELGRLT